jgi:hypothetical protein
MTTYNNLPTDLTANIFTYLRQERRQPPHAAAMQTAIDTLTAGVDRYEDQTTIEHTVYAPYHLIDDETDDGQDGVVNAMELVDYLDEDFLEEIMVTDENVALMQTFIMRAIQARIDDEVRVAMVNFVAIEIDGNIDEYDGSFSYTH